MKPFSPGTQRYKKRKSPSVCKCFSDGTHREAVGAIVVVPVEVRTVEIQITSVGIAVGRGRPAVAVGANIVDRRTTAVVAVARSGEMWPFG